MMGGGEYVVELPGEAPIGHFGLAVKNYAHSTAPNRRYADLITHRLLKAALAGQPAPYSNNDLQELAVHLTRRARPKKAHRPEETPLIEEVSGSTDALDTVAHPSKASRTPLSTWEPWLVHRTLTDC
ncbi:MAG: RNB domain-containing ribonuclease [Candidatus Xenobia bacterium]